MAYKSNIPGTLQFKVLKTILGSSVEVSASFNEVLKYSKGDGQIYFIASDGARVPLYGTPASHIVRFGSTKFTYSDDDSRVATQGTVS